MGADKAAHPAGSLAPTPAASGDVAVYHHCSREMGRDCRVRQGRERRRVEVDRQLESGPA
jgi:hypothetical protein